MGYPDSKVYSTTWLKCKQILFAKMLFLQSVPLRKEGMMLLDWEGAGGGVEKQFRR